MESVRLQLTEALVREAELDKGDVSVETAKVVALGLFRERKVSIGRAAELCGVTIADFHELARRHGVAILE